MCLCYEQKAWDYTFLLDENAFIVVDELRIVWKDTEWALIIRDRTITSATGATIEYQVVTNLCSCHIPKKDAMGWKSGGSMGGSGSISIHAHTTPDQEKCKE